MSSASRRLAFVSFGALVLASTSCHEGLLHEPADPTALVALSASMSRSGAGVQEAFDRADRLFVRFRVGNEVRFEQEQAFSPTADQTIVRLAVPVRGSSEAVEAELELRLGDQPLFRGVSSSTLQVGSPTPVSFTLEPVVAALSCGTGLLELTAYGQTAQLTGAALFATGDTVPGVPVVWSTPQNAVADVRESGLVAALQDGDVVATCSAAGVSATRTVRVLAVVSSIQLAPTVATLAAGGSLTYVPTLFDARGNVIPGARGITWSSASGNIASVTAAGVVTGVSPGNARIDATSGQATGSATLTVVPPSTAVTAGVTRVTGTSATLLGTVNPRGTATQAWFEWGTSPTLANATATPTQAAGSGTADVSLSALIGGLSPGTTYYFRIASSAASVVVRGSTLSFTTPVAPAVTTLGIDPANIYSYLGRGTFNPNGSATTAWFEYGVSPTLASFTQSTSLAMGSGSVPTTASQFLSGLQPNTTYYVRAAATSAGGTTRGSIASFRTGGAPALTATGSNLCGSPVTLNASAIPNGVGTYGWFEYGSSPSLSSYSSTSLRTLGNGTTSVAFSVSLVTPFYYRAVAYNMFGTVKGPISWAGAPPCIA